MSHYTEWLSVQLLFSSSDIKNSNRLHVSVAIGTFRRQPLSRMDDNNNALISPQNANALHKARAENSTAVQQAKKHPSNIASLGSEAKRHERSSVPHHWPAIGACVPNRKVVDEKDRSKGHAGVNTRKSHTGLTLIVMPHHMHARTSLRRSFFLHRAMLKGGLGATAWLRRRCDIRCCILLF